jgi:tRNA pseudouridine38-40 synthase
VRVALGVSYDGSGFEGWQSQPSLNTVQDVLERALSLVADAQVRVSAAGRTDTGVHAAAQVVHFDCEVVRPETAWVRGTNANLPPEVAVQWAHPVDGEFHARFSALLRSYRYVLYNHPVRNALLSRHVGWYHRELDVGRMKGAIKHLLGENDFSAFRSSECQAKSPVRTMIAAEVRAVGPHVIFEFRANAFLHHMVRNMVGSLIYVGAGKKDPGWIGELIAARDRTAAAPTFSPSGLYLSGVEYPEQWVLPAFARMMPFA